jgi:two-component system, NarL family, nitrate/nitrite response regulator NarL
MSHVVERTVLIDDSDIDLFIQRRFLEVYNFSKELMSYKSASEALAWLRQLSDETPPDMIFLDLNMPEVDGFSFLKSFEKLPETIKQKSKIVVLTSSNSSQDRDAAFKNKNVIRFITKPLKQVDIEDLKSMLSNENSPHS